MMAIGEMLKLGFFWKVTHHGMSGMETEKGYCWIHARTIEEGWLLVLRECLLNYPAKLFPGETYLGVSRDPYFIESSEKSESYVELFTANIFTG